MSSIVLNVLVLAITLLMMVSVGLSLEVHHFLALSKIKLQIIGLLVAQTLILPLIGLLTISLITLPNHIKLGVLLLAACPIGDIANFYVMLARANAAISVTLNSLSCAFAAITIPLAFICYSKILGYSLTYSVTYSQLITRLILLTFVPLGTGMLFRHLKPVLAERVLSYCRFLCTVGIIFIIVQMFITQYERLADAWRPTLLSASFMLIGSTLVGISVARILRVPESLKFGSSIVFPVRNIGLALAMSISLANRLDNASFALIFFLVEVPLLLGRVAYHRLRAQQHAPNDATLAV
ncbi:MAG TPA: hypothetical protein VLB68_06420 [Pyrinomonadaceae bacterium]|nr:hypothetical protein [Pyrinomonadaceae bacterium]